MGPFNIHIYGMGCTASYFSLKSVKAEDEKE